MVIPPCPAPDECWVFLVRHGSTDLNRSNPPKLQGRGIDPQLSEEGLLEAEQTARLLARFPIDAVLSSPLLRAKQTAETIARPHRLPVVLEKGITEVDVGIWEGLTWQQIEERYPAEYRAFMENAAENPYLGGESVGDVQARVLPVMKQLAERNLGKCVVVVAHNVVNRAFLAHVLGIPLVQFRTITQDNCGVNVLRYRAGRWKAVTINCVFHLVGTEGAD